MRAAFKAFGSLMAFQQNSEPQKSELQEMMAKALALHTKGKLSEAQDLYQAVLKATPIDLDALYRLGILCIQDKKPEEALPYLESAHKIQPQSPEILNSLGVALQMLTRSQEAVSHFQKALELNPKHLGALNNLGKALREINDYAAALKCSEKLRGLQPTNPFTLLDMGRCYFELSRFQEALTTFENALAENPASPDVLSALARTLWAMGRRSDAYSMLERARNTVPDNSRTLLNLGEFLYDEGKIEEALRYFNQTLSLAPKSTIALWRKSFGLLAKGDYLEGWSLYASRLGDPLTRGANRFAPQKPWDGSPAPNKHLLIWCEQGLGDSLQFIRYAKLCKERVGKVSLFCQKPLIRLFSALSYIEEVSDICKSKSFDEHVPLMNLPHLFQTTLENIPSDIPYLNVASDIRTKWASRFRDCSTELKVGLVWAGSAHHGDAISNITDAQRSLNFGQMSPWLKLRGIKFYSLQMGAPSQEIADSPLSKSIIDLMAEVSDFADTAAIIANLNLVISVDTSVAHLAGALGKPVWILSRLNADWRWLQNKPQNPWYPTSRIFGQKTIGNWTDVIEEIEEALKLESTNNQKKFSN